MADEEAGEMTSTSTSRAAEAGLLSRDTTAAIGSAFNTLTETVKQHQPSLEDVVRETLRPRQGIDKNLAKRACNVGQYRSASISKADADDATLIEPVKLAANAENPDGSRQ
jgi:hypothetical protein